MSGHHSFEKLRARMTPERRAYNAAKTRELLTEISLTHNTRKETDMADKPVLLTDEQMQQFIRDGYLILHPDFPEGFHEKVYKRIDESFEKNSGRNPGNNLLPAVPELQDVWDHPIVHGAFSSILGPDYYLHLHRHVHESRPGSDARTM
ncbi:MAG: hypothetical protein OXI59_23245, partial [Gemmatimonadota bacterium]|nr:hypothetical protein [Gemmatimonadota bacterium]